MTLPLDIGDQLVDRSKSSMLLYYLAKSTSRQRHREISQRKVELSIKQLKKLSTRDLHKHIDELKSHVSEALHSENQILAHQKNEEVTHKNLSQKITLLDKKLSKYLHSQESRKKRIAALESKVKHEFTSKRERIKKIKADIDQLAKLYKKAKKTKKYSKADLVRVSGRIADLKEKLTRMN